MDIHKLRAATPTPPPHFPTSTRTHAHAGGASSIDAAAWCFAQHTARHGPPPVPGGGHNAWLAALAKFCNDSGADLNDLLALALDTAPAGHDEDKIRATVTGIYRRDAAQYGSKPWQPPHRTAGNAAATLSGSPPAEAAPLDTPTIPASVYAALPELLQRCCQPFAEGHEQDVTLTAALAILSGCFPQLSGQYDGATVGANLYAFIIGPAANGKSGLSFARRLAYPTHAALVEQSRQAQRFYEAEAEQYAQRKRAAGKQRAAEPLEEPPTSPPFRQLYLPANNSAAGLIKSLAENEGRGIICDTEADTLSGSLKQDWGNFSDLLRKAFHHEAYTYQRKTGREFYELSAPALSIALTGTPGQVQALIPSAEDGLFSRFLFYYFDPPQTWRSVAPTNGRGNLTAYFDELAGYVSDLITAAAHPVTVALTPEQWQQLDAAGERALREAVAEQGGNVGSVIKRLGLSTYRLAMLLTLLRTAEDGVLPAGELTCAAEDFATALTLAEVCRWHALALYERLPKPTATLSAGRFAEKAEKAAQAQELHRQGKTLREITEALGVGKSTVERWLK